MLCAVVAEGNSVRRACAALGIPWSTYQGWRKQGDADVLEGAETTQALLVQEIDRARASASVHLVHVVQLAARTGDWRAAAWLAERIDPEEFSRPEVRATVRSMTAGGEVHEIQISLGGRQEDYMYPEDEDPEVN